MISSRMSLPNSPTGTSGRVDTDKYKFNVVEQIFGRYDAVGVQDKYIV
jgi:hypothetical protein